MIILASDHAGFMLKNKLKSWLDKKNIKYFDVGAINYDGMDSYVDYGKKAIDYFLQNCDVKTDKLLLICGSGVGMSIVANRNKSIRAVLAFSPKQAMQGRMHNDCNCLCMGARNTCFLKAKCIVNKFLYTNFLAGKHLDRIKSIS